MLLLPLAGGCSQTTTTLTKCPPFPWPNGEVIDYMQAGSERSNGVGNWWRDVIRHGEECEALNDV